MENGEDFTFSQVGLARNQDEKLGYDVDSSIEGLVLRDGSSDNTESVYCSDLDAKNRSSDYVPLKEEGSVGLLSFSVTRIPSDQVVTTRSTPGSSTAIEQNQMLSDRKPKPRKKVPFEKGYSQMDWLQLTRTYPDLAGLKGQSNRRLISLDEVKQHQTEGSMWTVLKGRVYNISPYMKFHPGGVDMLKKAVGRDCTSLFNKYHAWVNAEFLLEKCLVGLLEEAK